jgi:putative exosortase-associated protein (TIGR04073 family)
MKRSGKAVLILVILCLGFSCAVYAGDPVTKLSRGLSNILTSPIEYLNQYNKVAHQPDPVVPFFQGVLNGTAATLQRIFVGAYEVITFPVPVPADFAPIIEPATPMETMRQSQK